MRPLLPLALLFTLSACASVHRDRFYVLDALPSAPDGAPSNFTMQIGLRVTVPSLVDRNEMVMRTPDGVVVLEHERWAAPLADQMTTVLGQDIEQRRADAIVSMRRGAPPGAASVAIAVEVAALDAQQGQNVSMLVRWRIEESGTGKITEGRETFTRATRGDGYAAVAQALSACVGALADRLIQELPQSPPH